MRDIIDDDMMLLTSTGSGRGCGGSSNFGLGPFPFLLIANPSGFGLKVPDLSQVKPDGPGAKRVSFWSTTMLFISCPESTYKGIKAAPSLAERAGARGWRVWDTKIRAGLVMNLGLPKLIQIPEELKYVGPTTHGEREWWPVVPQVLAEGVPVPPLLVLVPAWSGGSGCGHGCRGGG